MENLGAREEAILDYLVTSYVATGEPVGSRTLSKSGLGVSAATVRNSMADLEEKGFLSHPHTSAGRVPTDKGYRYYVDRVMPNLEIEEEERDFVRRIIESKVREGNIEELLTQVSKLVADVTHQLGIVLKPRFEMGVFQRIDLVQLSEVKVLLILTIRSGLVKTLIMEMDVAIEAGELEDTARVVNERLSGLTVAQIRDSVNERFRSISRGSPRLLRILADSADAIFSSSSVEDLHIGGAGNILLHPDLVNNQAEAAALMNMLEDGSSITSILGDRKDQDGISITIGNENEQPALKDFSVLTSRYRVGSLSGVIGIIGPKRLPYPKLAGLVQYMAKLTESLLESK